MYLKVIKLFLRFSVATSMLSAVADRFGFWGADISVWGNMETFLQYTQTILPWLPASLIPFAGWSATILEIVFGVFLLIGFKTELVAKLTGLLILSFSLSMLFSVGVKPVFDYSALNATAAAFAISLLKDKFLEVDVLLRDKK